MKHHLLTWLAAVTLLAAANSPAWACSHCSSDACGGCDGSSESPCADGCGAAADCGPAMVTKTVYEPQYTTETRTVTRHGSKTEQRERQVTTYKRVTISEEKTSTYTVMVPETRTKTVTYTHSNLR